MREEKETRKGNKKTCSVIFQVFFLFVSISLSLVSPSLSLTRLLFLFLLVYLPIYLLTVSSSFFFPAQKAHLTQN